MVATLGSWSSGYGRQCAYVRTHTSYIVFIERVHFTRLKKTLDVQSAFWTMVVSRRAGDAEHGLPTTRYLTRRPGSFEKVRSIVRRFHLCPCPVEAAMYLVLVINTVHVSPGYLRHENANDVPPAVISFLLRHT